MNQSLKKITHTLFAQIVRQTVFGKYNENLKKCIDWRFLSRNLSTSSILSTARTTRHCSKFTAARDPHTLPPGTAELNPERAFEVVLSLNDEERVAVRQALEKYEAQKIKEGFEGQLAATRWRSKFGRPAKMPALGQVDPTGSYCAVPDDWLKKKFAEKATPPTSSDLWKIFFVNAVPFIGFGFLDNFTMIIAGDYIEQICGMYMCISTMAAAGLGNTISDVLGIGSAYYIERASEMLGLRPPSLTPYQLDMKSSRRSANSGRIFGITLGCLVGMFPLLFMDTQPTVKKLKEMNDFSNTQNSLQDDTKATVNLNV